MKITRSYWLGLGSGLILSALLTLAITPIQGQPVTALLGSPAKEQSIPSSSTQPSASTKPPASPQSSTLTPPSTSNLSPAVTQPPQSQLSNTQSSTSIERSFVIPEGASAERIADLLVAQGFIKDKVAFLDSAHQMGAESKFRSGTFNLSLGLTLEELIHRLLKK
ncbi:ABC transporter substrate-binding protein [Desulfosporosinus sp. Sb-LF]|uniref:ABC transporter substrate-binding protein n=1 Tax=Desulfosporosinus sp. Sb-LF TaxID=2560027 RepID=UPI00107F672F|nr:ABC transporter substrate-binding protein [Desulfosporosinus sp. Sb-LF]TGE33057.1 ABC transporter substrate-binding protein [Desulfosporosinus sp. Sb-LF]